MSVGDINIAIIVVFVVFFAGLWGWTYREFIQKINKDINDIKELNLELSVFNHENAEQSFQEIDRIFDKSNICVSSWEGYSSAMIRYQDYNGFDHIYSTVDSEEYFNFEAMTVGFNMSFWQNLGSIFTGLGILGTFLGLTFGVGAIAVNVNDVDLMKIGIGNLLSGLSTAFGTSIFGILSAICYNAFVYKLKIEKIEKEIIVLNNKLNSMFTRKIAEQILCDTYQKAEEQAVQFNEFSSQLAISIGDALANKLEDSELATDMKDVKSSLENIEKIMTNDLGIIIGQAIADNFSNKFEATFEALNESISRLGTTGLDAVRDTIEQGTSAQIDAFSKNLSATSSVLEAASVRLVETSSSVNSALIASINDVIDRLEQSTIQSATQLDAQRKSMVSASETMSTEINKALASLIQQASENRMEMKASHDEMNANIQRAFANTSESINALFSESINNTVENINTEMKKILDASDVSQHKMQATTEQINKDMQLSVDIAIKKLNDVLALMATNVEVQQNRLAESNKATNDSIQASMENMKLQVETMIRAHNFNIEEAQKKIISFINDAKSGLSENQQALEKMSGTITILIDKAYDTAKAFDTAAEPIKGIADKVQAHTDKMIALNEVYDEKIHNGISALAEAVEVNRKGYTELQDNLTEVLNHWREYNVQYGAEKEAIAKIFEKINENLKDYQDKINDSYSNSLEQYDAALGKAYAQLGSLIEDLAEAITDSAQDKSLGMER